MISGSRRLCCIHLPLDVGPHVCPEHLSGAGLFLWVPLHLFPLRISKPQLHLCPSVRPASGPVPFPTPASVWAVWEPLPGDPG